MAHKWAGVGMAVACTAVSALCLAAPALAGDGVPVDGTVGGATGSAIVEDTVRKAVKRVGRSPQETAARVRDAAADLRGVATERLRDITGVGGPQREDDPAPAAADARVQGSPNPSSGQQAHRVLSAHGRAPVVGRTAHRKAKQRSAARVVAAYAVRQMAGLPAARAHPCKSGSLAPGDLRRCARAGVPLPGLGGFPAILPPAGLAMVGLGLALLALGRRRDNAVGPAA